MRLDAAGEGRQDLRDTGRDGRGEDLHGAVGGDDSIRGVFLSLHSAGVCRGEPQKAGGKGEVLHGAGGVVLVREALAYTSGRPYLISSSLSPDMPTTCTSQRDDLMTHARPGPLCPHRQGAERKLASTWPEIPVQVQMVAWDVTRGPTCPGQERALMQDISPSSGGVIRMGIETHAYSSRQDTLSLQVFSSEISPLPALGATGYFLMRKATILVVSMKHLGFTGYALFARQALNAFLVEGASQSFR